MSAKRQGLRVWVYRNPLGECTNGGVTSRFDSFVLTGPGITGPSEPDEQSPELRYCVEKVGGINGSILRVCARVVDDQGEPISMGAMMGGNFVYTTDSRMPKVPGQDQVRAPIPVHDRFEH